MDDPTQPRPPLRVASAAVAEEEEEEEEQEEQRHFQLSHSLLR